MMKVVILAGGFGTRISEESYLKPKPMIEVGDMPILWHIMKEYSQYGFNEFIICCGYKQHLIKQFFSEYFLHTSDVTFDLENNEMKVHNTYSEKWKVTLVDTGLNTMTGGRIKRIKKYIGKNTFLLTYGDGVSDVNILKTIEFHKREGKFLTMTTVQPKGRFGVLDIEDNQVQSFREKSEKDMGWINGGYMVVEPEVFDYIEGDNTIFEREPLERLAREGQIAAYRHNGFWQCMDTMRDKNQLEKMWNTNSAPWKIWEENDECE